MKRKIITIAGRIGAGKSSTGRAVAQPLDYPHYSSGDFMRTLAHERDISMAELSHQAETDFQIDILIDQRQQEFFNTQDEFVIDSRLGWLWCPDSFKVFLELDTDIAARRIFNDMKTNPNRSSETASSIQEVKKNIIDRFASEQRRYKDLYDVDNHADHAHFDLVIDTGIPENNIPSVVAQIIAGYRQWLDI